jgi:hypothetical protein
MQTFTCISLITTKFTVTKFSYKLFILKLIKIRQMYFENPLKMLSWANSRAIFKRNYVFKKASVTSSK